jgi:hypothetical protein
MAAASGAQWDRRRRNNVAAREVAVVEGRDAFAVVATLGMWWVDRPSGSRSRLPASTPVGRHGAEKAARARGVRSQPCAFRPDVGPNCSSHFEAFGHRSPRGAGRAPESSIITFGRKPGGRDSRPRFVPLPPHETWAPDIAGHRTGGPVITGRAPLPGAIANATPCAGVQVVLDRVIASREITGLEARLRNPSHAPDHRPTATTQVHLHPAATRPAASHSGRLAGKRSGEPGAIDTPPRRTANPLVARRRSPARLECDLRRCRGGISPPMPRRPCPPP